jgi:G6PDH family F420-dependent oxidoreductase
MLDEAVHIIRDLLDGGYVNHRGTHFEVDSAKIWDLPADPVRIGIAVSGQQSCALAGELADAMIAVEPDGDLGSRFDEAGGSGKPRVGQMPISYDIDRDAAVARAHAQFRWFAGGWKVNAELPGPAGFDAASQFVRPDDVVESIPCGDDVDAIVEGAKEWAAAGFTHLALVQVGGDAQDAYLAWAESELLPALRSI